MQTMQGKRTLRSVKTSERPAEILEFPRQPLPERTPVRSHGERSQQMLVLCVFIAAFYVVLGIVALWLR